MIDYPSGCTGCAYNCVAANSVALCYNPANGAIGNGSFLGNAQRTNCTYPDGSWQTSIVTIYWSYGPGTPFNWSGGSCNKYP